MPVSPAKTPPVLSIEKASGGKEPFSEEKLERSLRGAGASPRQVQTVLDLIRRRIYPGINTRKIYRMAFDLLHREARHLAARYSLKRAVMSLGPSGYPFEKFIGALLEKQGYETRVDVQMEGACVSHEVDVVASKGRHQRLVECKFHNREGVKCDIKVALYVYARSLDLKNHLTEGHSNEFWLVTNTKFTTDAIKYGGCVGLNLLSWDFPPGKGLKEWIEREELHPLTCLTTLKTRQKKKLLEQNVVLCRELTHRPGLLSGLGVTQPQIRRILKEVESLAGA
ncbi:MAG: restriction endonuclease [Nitrospinaceae bacterium]